MSKQAILFDIDGTLVDSNEAHVNAWCEAFNQAGHHFDRATIHHQIGKGGDNLVPSLLPRASDEERERIDHAHGGIYKLKYIDAVRPFPGARELLRHAAENGQKVVLASSASRKELDHYVDLLGARDLLTATTSKDDVTHSKPCPDIFAKALEKSGCASPEDAIVVGDTPYDISAARKLGVAAVAVRSGGFPEDELRACQPVAIYDDVAALLADYASSPLRSAPKAATAETGLSADQIA